MSLIAPALSTFSCPDGPVPSQWTIDVIEPRAVLPSVSRHPPEDVSPCSCSTGSLPGCYSSSSSAMAQPVMAGEPSRSKAGGGGTAGVVHGRPEGALGLPADQAARASAGSQAALGPQPDRPVHPGGARGRRAAPRPGGRPGGPDPPRDLRPDRSAPDARGGRRLPRRHAAATPTSGWSIGCWRARITASAGPSTGWTWPTTPTRTASSSTPSGPTPGGIATGWCRP